MGVLCMILFSICVLAAEGLHYGVVPYVSRPALGVVSGMVGAGGNLGAVIGSSLIVAPTYPTDEGFINLGIVIMTVSCLMFFLYWPEKGGMLVKAGGLMSWGSYLMAPGLVSMDPMSGKSTRKRRAANGGVAHVHRRRRPSHWQSAAGIER